VLTLIVPLVPDTVDVATVRADMSLCRDLGLDSLALWGLILRFAEWLGVEPDDLVDAMDGEHVKTAADLVALGVKINGVEEGLLS
jgi:acyl carrier protein